MVRTGARATTLSRLLSQAGLKTAKPPAGPRIGDLDDEVAHALLDTYRRFGGTDAGLLRPGAWDLAVGDSLVLELDEELHFNRYRRATLEHTWARRLPWAEEYEDLCARTETACLRAGRWGKRWTNPSCEAMFGGADTPGVFTGHGSPRWKQRALYDAMKDGYAASRRELRVARLSVHDDIAGTLLGTALEEEAPVDLDALTSLLDRRTL